MILGCLFLAEFGSGLGVMMLDISVGAIFAAVIPDRLRSRVAGAYMVVKASSPRTAKPPPERRLRPIESGARCACRLRP